MGKRTVGMQVRAFGLGLGLASLLLAGASGLRAQTLSAIPNLDEKKLEGSWYEVARYPAKREKKCTGDAVELIARGDKPHELEWVDSCQTKRGYMNVRNSNAYPQNKKTPGDGKFKVYTLYPFAKKYWVLAVGPDYEWSLIGSPNHKGLWVFSKTATLSPDVLDQIEARGAAEGFPSAKLIKTPQSAAPPSGQ